MSASPQQNYLQPKKSRKGLWIGVIIVIIVVVIVVGIIATSYHPSQVSTTQPIMVTVTAIDLSIQYTGISSGYLGGTSNSLTGFTATAGSQFSYSITFTSSAILLTHSINSIYVNTPGFSIASSSPSLPYSFSPGSTFTVTINLNVPSTAYTGVLNIVVETS